MRREWKPVVGYESRYAVSDDGQVRSLDVAPSTNSAGRRVRGKRARIMRQTPAGKGYWTVTLSDGSGGQRRAYVHRMMAAAFFGPSDQDVRHLDDDRDNNVIANLAYGTQSLNEYDKIRNGNHHQVDKTHCPAGHPYDSANTYRPPSGGRYCRQCSRISGAAYYARKKARV